MKETAFVVVKKLWFDLAMNPLTMDRFGGAHYALASYNAGEQRIARWIAERPGFTQDEFIDDFPFPETQNYVKRILRTADDYRRLYGVGRLSPTSATR